MRHQQSHRLGDSNLQLFPGKTSAALTMPDPHDPQKLRCMILPLAVFGSSYVFSVVPVMVKSALSSNMTIDPRHDPWRRQLSQ